jgi:F420-dependent oxidoreductase-like protein
MEAMTIDYLSGGRLQLGLGVSGPQVVEGWYGVPFPKPLARTREYVSIVRSILARTGPVAFDGAHYPLPYPGGTGLGKPLKITTHPLRPDVPILLAAEGPRNVALAVEIADGWLPIFFSPERYADVHRPSLERGFATRGGAPAGFDVAPLVPVALNDDVVAAREQLKPLLALYVGGMGARGANFYNALVRRYGYEAEAERIQELYLDGHQRDAIASVPDALVDELALVGPRQRIGERLAAWRESGATTLLVSTRDLATLRAVAELAL